MAAICGKCVMLMTCLWLFPISSMMCAIFSATPPLTPVSISSKIIVGSFTAPLIIAFRESITRAISPPEATCDTGLKGEFVLALNRNETLSFPFGLNSFGLMSTLKLILGIPSGTNLAFISNSIVLAAFFLIVVNLSACCVQLSNNFATISFCFCISSSL